MLISHSDLNQQLKSAGIGFNATELHGFFKRFTLWRIKRSKLATALISIQQ